MTPLLTVSNVSRDFIKSLDLVAKFLNRLGQDHREEIVHAVDNVSLEVFKGEVVGIVGESGLTDNADHLTLENLKRDIIHRMNDFFPMILPETVKKLCNKVERLDEIP